MGDLGVGLLDELKLGIHKLVSEKRTHVVLVASLARFRDRLIKAVGVVFDSAMLTCGRRKETAAVVFVQIAAARGLGRGTTVVVRCVGGVKDPLGNVGVNSPVKRALNETKSTHHMCA